MHKGNSLLEMDVRDELAWDPILDDSRIDVIANDGRVTLSGAVPTYYQSILAGEDAWSVAGVSSVDNELLVGTLGETIADAAIAAACAAALEANSLVPEGSVSVEVTHGWVTLQGSVEYYYQREEAVYAVRRVTGVRGISDDVEISSDSTAVDVADRINKAFRRNAIVDDSLITVTDSDHTVYLDGTVESWAAMDEAVATAWQAPGVQNVVNRLVVVP
jgi:osmotically-inducible protein OsmY